MRLADSRIGRWLGGAVAAALIAAAVLLTLLRLALPLAGDYREAISARVVSKYFSR